MNFKGKRVIVYGLGKQYQRQKQFLESEFDIVGLSDKKQLNIQGYIKPENISTCDFDYLYITSGKYLDEIKKELLKQGGDKGGTNNIAGRYYRMVQTLQIGMGDFKIKKYFRRKGFVRCGSRTNAI